MKKLIRFLIIFLLLFSTEFISIFANCSCKQLYEIYNTDEKGFEKGIGFIDCSGKVIFKPIFKEVGKFDNGVAVVIISKKYIGLLENGQPKYQITSGIIDINGRMVRLENTWITGFSEGLAFAKMNDKYMYINNFGKIQIQIPMDINPPIDFDNISYKSNFKNGFARLPSKDGREYTIDKEGKISLSNPKPEFDENGLEFRIENTRYAVLDKSGNYVLEPRKNSIGQYSDILYSESDSNNQVYEFFNLQGKKLYEVKADYIGGFNEGLAVIESGGKFGFINKKGEIEIPAKFENAVEFSEGLAAVEINNKMGFIDKKGKFVIPPKFEFENNYFECGLVRVEQKSIKGKDKWGYLNRTGKWVWRDRSD